MAILDCNLTTHTGLEITRMILNMACGGEFDFNEIDQVISWVTINNIMPDLSYHQYR
jgi:hypothetical protein